MKTRADLQQRADPAANFSKACSWYRNPGQYFEQRAFSGAVGSNDPDNLARLDFKRDIFQRPKTFSLATRVAVPMEQQTETFRDLIAQSVMARFSHHDLVLFRQLFYSNGKF